MGVIPDIEEQDGPRQSELIDFETDAVAASDLRLFGQSSLFLAANERQLQQAKAGLQEAQRLGVDTSDWEYIVASCQRAVTHEKFQLDLIRARIAGHTGMSYVPKSFS